LIHAFRRKLNGSAVAPASYELRGELFLREVVASTIARCPMVQELAECPDSLANLSVNHEGSVHTEQVGHWRDRAFACLVGVTEQEFSRSKRHPCFAVRRQLTLTRLRAATDAEVVRIAKPIGVAEV